MPATNRDIKNKKFRMLAEKRVTVALQRLDLIGNLSSRTNYVYSRAEVDRIFKALEGKIKEIKDQFTPSRASAKPKDEFKF